MKLTDSQRAAVDYRGSNLLVAASAGAGKTEVLARRCVSLIADSRQPCGVERLLVVTFTRAAAAELRVRVARMLREAAQQAQDADLRRHLRRQELLVDAADIGTIDGWCGRIVREHFAAAGVDVDFTVLADADARLLRRQVLDELFAGIHAGGEALADEARAWIARAAVPDDAFLRTLVADLNTYRDHLVNPEHWFGRARASANAADGAAVLAAALRAECLFQHEQLRAIRAAAAADIIDRTTAYCAALPDWHRRLADPAALLGVCQEIDEFELRKPDRRKRDELERPVLTQVRERWLDGRLKKPWSRPVVAAILQHESATVALAATLLRLEERYQTLLARTKQARAACEFADVLRLTLDLLGEPTAGRQRQPTDIARQLQRRYEHILVDEYQDTSPVQVEILRLITRTEPGRTNRFMVGDVKQSIYGFREAEPRLFAELAAAFEEGRAAGRVQYLADNFRSHAGVLTALNGLFAALFDHRLGGTSYGEKERLCAGRLRDEISNPTLDGTPRVQIHVVEHERRRAWSAAGDDDAQELTELIEREAQFAAREIQAMLRAGVQVPERSASRGSGLRPLQLTDIAILLRSAVHKASQVARVLRANGLHCLASGRESLLDTLEVRDVCGVLELLLNRRQDVPLAAYLRGPFVGLSEAELLAVRRAGPRESADYYEAVDEFRQARPSAALAAKLDAALSQLDRWAAAAREEELPALLRRILQDSNLALAAAALRGGEQRVALLRALQSFARAYAGAGGGAVDDFVEYLAALADQALDPSAPTPGPEDAVRILTIHGAKGLEFPVVFLLGAGTKFNTLGQRRTLLCDEELGFGIKFFDYRARAAQVSAQQQVIAQEAARKELEEELRLLYVAATRARERLYIVGQAAPGAWEECRQLYGAGGPPPLIARLSVRSSLEWVLMAAAALRPAQPAVLDVGTHAAGDISVAEPGHAAPASAPTAVWEPSDEQWVARGRELLAAEVDSTLAELPAMMSVSAIKELALRLRDADRPHIMDAGHEPLERPAFVRGGATADGRELGTACHRFLEWAELGRLRSATDVADQLRELVSTGRMSAEAAGHVPVADIAWFAGTSEGRLSSGAAGGVRREVPFVYALPIGESGEHTIVRGVIDCLVETPAGLIILDYKTDAVRDHADLEARLAGYRVQVQLYAQAASAIFTRPVVRATLIFLRARQVIDVPLAAGSPGP